MPSDDLEAPGFILARYPVPMLTAAEITNMRRRVQHRQCPIEGDRVVLHFTDGPLDRLSVPVSARDAAALFIGWATVTPTGCVQAIYRRSDGNVRTFDG